MGRPDASSVADMAMRGNIESDQKNSVGLLHEVRPNPQGYDLSNSVDCVQEHQLYFLTPHACMHACTHIQTQHTAVIHTHYCGHEHKAILYVILPLARTTKLQHIATSKYKQLTELTKFS